MTLRSLALTSLALTAAVALLLGACKPDASKGVSPRSAGFQVDPGFELNGNAEAAKDTYAQQCATCHGQLGDAKGPAGGALQPPPTDFTKGGIPAHRAYVAIADGGPAVGKAPTMAAFSASLDDQMIRDLTAYVLQFAK